MILAFDAEKFSNSALSQITPNKGILRNPNSSGFRNMCCLGVICERRNGWVSYIYELAAILANTLNIITTFQNDRNILRRN
jgi:hypothetical protein